MPLTLFERVVCERELETEQNCNILTPTLLAITAFLSRSPGLLNRGPGGPASLGDSFLYRILSSTRLIPTDWISCTLSDIIVQRPPSSCGRHNFALIQPVHGQGYNILIFLDRMYLLFTQVHFLFWQPGRVRGQYIRIGVCLIIWFSVFMTCIFFCDGSGQSSMWTLPRKKQKKKQKQKQNKKQRTHKQQQQQLISFTQQNADCV